MGQLWEKRFIRKNQPDRDTSDEGNNLDGDKSFVVESAPSPEDKLIAQESALLDAGGDDESINGEESFKGRSSSDGPVYTNTSTRNVEGMQTSQSGGAIGENGDIWYLKYSTRFSGIG